MYTTIKNLVSIPRSGQHVTERALNHYYNLINVNFEYCEFYSCCKTRPCMKYKYCYQKNHDFDLKTTDGIIINDNEKYLFLYRDSIFEQLESYFRYELMRCNVIPTSNTYIEYDDKIFMDRFIDFVKDWYPYYQKIMSKYLIKKSNILQIEFNEYLLNFNETFKKILIFFDIPVKDEFIEKTKLFINPVKNIKIQYKYYNKLNDYINNLVNIDINTNININNDDDSNINNK